MASVAYVYSARSTGSETSDDNLSSSSKTSWMFELFQAVIGQNMVLDAPVVPASLMGASPHEGLALVECYMRISDPAVRQALLNLASLLAASDI